jgi:hypothetical protein
MTFIVYLDEANKPKLARLALLNEKVETMKKQRETLMSDFRRKIQDDDITKLVLMQRQDNHKVIYRKNEFRLLKIFLFRIDFICRTNEET